MAKKRLIDANALTDKCRQICADEWNKRAAPCCWSDAYEGFIEDIEEAPTVDAVEVVHGRWMHHGNGIAYCSNCEVDAVEDATNFCPNCGAKMDGE